MREFVVHPAQAFLARMRVSVVANEVLSLVHMVWLATLLRKAELYRRRASLCPPQRIDA